MADDRPIIIKRVKKKGGHGHHGGAWKIAYADFVTAMMAFFLLMWLISNVSEEQLSGIAEYFSPNASSDIIGGAGGIMGGKVLGQGNLTSQAGTPYEEISEDDARQKLAEAEEEQFEDTKSAIEQTLKEDPELDEMKEHLVIDNTPEGMRIQLIDQENAAMFKSGSKQMTPTAEKLLSAVSNVIKKIPQKIAIEGNTDALPFVGRTDYDNWDLSADRALASRRQLEKSGIEGERILRVTGRADTDLYDPENPNSANNRRISIIMLRNHTLKPKEEKKPQPKRASNPFSRFQPTDEKEAEK